MTNDQTSSSNILFTGASSKLGSRVARDLVDATGGPIVWCGTHRSSIGVQHQRIKTLPLDLKDPIDLSPIAGPIDLTVQFAGETHALAAETYEAVNHLGTTRLAEAVQERGCRNFVYISTRCIGPDSGAYGCSKQAAENSLRDMQWECLLILRPSEIYGIGGTEGIDRFINMGKNLHIVPLLFGSKGIRFSPMHFEDFLKACRKSLRLRKEGLTILELCGPEVLSGTALALRVIQRYGGVPIPVWIPALSFISNLSKALGFPILAPDQLERLTGGKSAEHPSDHPALDFEMIKFLNP